MCPWPNWSFDFNKVGAKLVTLVTNQSLVRRIETLSAVQLKAFIIIFDKSQKPEEWIILFLYTHMYFLSKPEFFLSSKWMTINQEKIISVTSQSCPQTTTCCIQWYNFCLLHFFQRPFPIRVQAISPNYCGCHKDELSNTAI